MQINIEHLEQAASKRDLLILRLLMVGLVCGLMVDWLRGDFAAYVESRTSVESKVHHLM